MSRKPKPPVGDFASAQLFALAVYALKDMNPGLLDEGAKAPDFLARATIEPQAKASLLLHAFERGGALPLLMVGSYLHAFGDAPVIEVLRKSEHPRVLAQKWLRLEQYYHSANRTSIEMSDDGIWRCKRYSRGAREPSDPENLLICGMLAGFLGLAGCDHVEGEVGGICFVGGQGKSLPIKWPEEPTSCFVLRWRKAEAAPGESGESDVEGQDGGQFARRLSVLLNTDVGRVWRLEDAARALGRSVRSLQRDIQSSGHSFTSLVRGARVREASRLLAETETAISEVGYCCGYADQAHFQRDFRKAVNMTPLQFREMGQLSAP